MRLAMGIEYDGGRYHGWQRQSHCDSVQERLERAIGRVADRPVEVVCAGRTDRGVHATNQVVHLDVDVERPLYGWQMGTIQHLPRDITVLWVRSVGEDFHARFSATAREYRYCVLNRSARPALSAGRLTWWYRPLDADRMQEAAAQLLGEHDFSSFRGKDCQAHSPVRTMESIRVTRQGDHLLIDVRANAFLHHMVRNIVGSLFAIGSGERPVEWLAEALAERDREAAGITAPADGLYLTAIDYPSVFDLPTQPRRPLFEQVGGFERLSESC
ncbi:tRNA pseudouridine(38-40) synthase TruA [Guyparkeria sp.]|uniref:tRNA pseudouridine(38-40) synthase TruA n=1 Tax=Guyparkeria sp. TaxID=2035736 RepID=UPI0039710353